MEKILFISPHLSTGGSPQFTLNKITLLKDDFEIWCIEYNFVSSHYVVQRNKIANLLQDKFISIGDNKDYLINLINQINPDYLCIEEFSETFIDERLCYQIYNPNRNYVILETTHSSNKTTKKFFPDKFIFVSKWSEKMYKGLGVDYEVIEYPIDKKEKENILNFDKKFKHILNVGLFTPGKNQGYAFKLAKELESEKIMFHFVGNCAPNFEEYWKPLLKEKPHNCHIWGERDDVDDFIQSSDLFLFTSIFELNPLVIKEALCYKIPILMFNLETYLGSYNNVENIHFLNGNLESDKNLILKILHEK